MDLLLLDFHRAGLFLEEELREAMREQYIRHHSFRYGPRVGAIRDPEEERRLLERMARDSLIQEAEAQIRGYSLKTGLPVRV
jgi:hypothetical protein